MPRKVLARPRNVCGCTRMTNIVAPNVFHQFLFTFSHTNGSAMVLISPEHGHWLESSVSSKQLLPGSVPSRKDWKRSLFSASWSRSCQPTKGSGAREMKAEGLLPVLCFHKGLHKHRSTRNKVSGAVLPVALPPVMTSGLFTLESCTTSILYNCS